jgi:hypothetical protein
MDGEQTAHPIEQEARTLGWVPAEDFKGDPNRWVDAETLVERGHTVMPILRKNNERLESLVKQQSEELNKMKSLFSASQESITELQKVHADATKAAVAKARAEVMSELKEAKRDGDVDREIALTEELQELKTRQVEIDKPAPAPTQQQQQQVHPEFQAWMDENPWFGTDTRKTQKAMGIAQILRADPENDNLTQRAFFDRVMAEMEGRTRPAADKVGGARPTGTGGGGGTAGGKSFADLPADAKAACENQGRKLVGEGRAFKDMAAWRSYYTNLYFQ